MLSLSYLVLNFATEIMPLQKGSLSIHLFIFTTFLAQIGFVNNISNRLKGKKKKEMMLKQVVVTNDMALLRITI